MRRLCEIAADVFAVQRAAAEIDSVSAQKWADASSQRRDHMRGILAPVAAQLAHPLERSADVLDAMIGFDLYDQLVRRAGWSPGEYEEWLARTLANQLLGAGIQPKSTAM